MFNSSSSTFHFPDFKPVRALVVGDLMLDRYWSGSTRRISPEAPVPIVQIDTWEDRPGGAANVARNLAALEVQTALIGIIGADEAGKILINQLKQLGIKLDLIQRVDLPTITKLRILSHHQQLLRIDREQILSHHGEDPIIPLVFNLINHMDLVILSDYAKGTLPNPQALIQLAREHNKIILIDPKGREFERYRGATVLTPNRFELEMIVGECSNDQILAERSQNLLKKLELTALVITLSERGLLLIRPDQAAIALPTQTHDVFDVTGAGDTVIATLAAALGAGLNILQACVLANRAAGIAVGKLGAVAISVDELKLACEKNFTSSSIILKRDDLLATVATARARGERIVMTNGCFDLLHAGHVAYLQAARQLGDRLLVAVNDDESVRRLKGPKRPINLLKQRLAVLAGLASVDWVSSFTEDTPETLIHQVNPEILVKGGDYQPERIAGADWVCAHGGEVKILPYLSNCSTSQMIEAILQLS